MQLNNQPAVIRQPRFDGINANRIEETYTMGVQAITYLRDVKFAHLARNKKLELKLTKYHPHGYAAFCRKHCDSAITIGLNSQSRMVDVGGHAMRSHESQYADNTKWTTKTHSMLPIVDPNDELRHSLWKEKYTEKGWAWPLPNSCNSAASRNGLCQCPGAIPNSTIVEEATAFKSIDSAYYPGVMEGIETEQIKAFRKDGTMKPAYYVFHDYHQALRKGITEGTTMDNESQFHLTSTDRYGDRMYCAKVHTNENQFCYEHPIVNTEPADKMCPDTWVRLRDGLSVVYNIIYRMSTGGGYDYITVRSQVIPSKHALAKNHPYFARLVNIPANDMRDRGQTWAEKVRSDMSFSEDMLEPWYKYVLAPCTFVGSKLKDFVLSIWNLKDQVKNRYAIGLKVIDPAQNHEIFEITVVDKNTFDLKTTQTFRFNHDYLLLAMKVLAGKAAREDMVRAMRVVSLHHTEKSGDRFYADAQCVPGAVNYAMWLNAEMMIDMFTYYDGNSRVDKVQKYLKGVSFAHIGTFTQRIRRWFMQRMWPIIWLFLTVFTLVNIGNAIIDTTFSNKNFMAKANPGSDEMVAMGNDFLTMFIVSLIVTLAKTLMPTTIQTRWLKGSCVTDKSRLDLKKAGVVDPHWKFRCADWDIRGLTGQQAAEKLGCRRHGKIEAGQIGPIVWGGEYRTPTIKHTCKQCVLAASIRATTNKVQPDDAYIQMWEDIALKPMFEELARSINLAGGISVKYEDWLKKYPGEYREKMEKQLRCPDVLENVNAHMYDSFPKKELQYTTVAHDLKDTELNTVKERQISGPSIDKKIIANALINLLEEHATNGVKGYCGRENWQSISAKVDEAIMRIPNGIWCCADGSGFDMTQTKKLQQAFNRRMLWLLQTGLIDLGHMVNIDQVMECFYKSETLTVNLDRGSAQYKAEGRASGDGWTTFGNTMLMASYWRFVFALAGVEDFSLLVKGDDVLFRVPIDKKDIVESTSKLIFVSENKECEWGLGQILKSLKWGDIEDCDFLSCMFFHSSTGVRMVRIPDRVFQTMPWSLKISPGMNNLEECRRELIHSKGMSLLAWAEGLPIFEKYARKLMALGKPGLLTEYNKYADEGRTWMAQDDRYQFIAWLSYRFNITDADVAEIEDAIERITEIDCELEIPCLGKFQVSE